MDQFSRGIDSKYINGDDAGKKAGEEIQEVLRQNPHGKHALKLLVLATNKGAEALIGSRQTRQLFAQQLQQRVTDMGYEMSTWVGDGEDQGRVLNLGSDMFRDTGARVQFVTSVLPDWKKDLCRIGFRQVRLTKGGVFELGKIIRFTASIINERG